MPIDVDEFDENQNNTYLDLKVIRKPRSAITQQRRRTSPIRLRAVSHYNVPNTFFNSNNFQLNPTLNEEKSTIFISTPDLSEKTKHHYINVHPVKELGYDQTINEYFNQLKNALLSIHHLYNDDEFPACDYSLSTTESMQIQVQWRRIRDLQLDANFLTNIPTLFHLRQGLLGDSWFFSAVGCVAQNCSLSLNLINRQNLDYGYAGLFLFRFWFINKWQDVIIDDQLPTFDGQLLYLTPTSRNEYWLPLLQKAYAKFCGSYELSDRNTFAQCIKDLTGAPVETLLIQSQSSSTLLWRLTLALKTTTLITVSNIRPNTGTQVNKKGLLINHIYIVKKLFKVRDLTQNDILLVQLKNLWANITWTGEWSYQSSIWQSLSNEVQLELLRNHQTNTFWMSYNDFITSFTYINFIYLSEMNIFDDTYKNRLLWHMVYSQKLIFKIGFNAGGPPSVLDSFHVNPQLLLQAPNDTQIIIEINTAELNVIDCSIYRVPLNCVQSDIYRKEFFINQQQMIISSLNNDKNVLWHFMLPPGYYLLIPHHDRINIEGTYFIRLYSDRNVNIRELDCANKCFKNMKNIVLSPEQIEELKNETCYEKSNMPLSTVFKTIFNCLVKQDMLTDDTSSMLVSIFQLQRMKYKEFDRLVECAIDTSQWQLIYENMTNTTTRNSSNTISTFNLRELFAACGIVISNRVLKNIIEQHCPDGEIDVINWLIIMCKTDAIFHFNSINKTTLTEQYVLSQLHMLYQITP